MRKLVAFVLSLTLLMPLASCGSGSGEGEWLSFRDSLGNEVALDAPPRRVAVLFSSLADMWLLSGGEIAITVGESVERGFAPSEVLLVDTGAGKHISSELLISYEPDLVIYSADIPAQLDAAELLREVGIKAAGFKVENFSDYLSVLDIMTDITGNKEAYREYGSDLARKIDALISSAKDKPSRKILFIRAATSSKATKAKRAEDHFVAAMLEELGCQNIADSAEILLDGLSIEHILRENPDMIFISSMGNEEAVRAYFDEVLEGELWQELSAVKEGRYYYLSKELSQYKPNSAWYEAYLELWEILYGNEK